MKLFAQLYKWLFKPLAFRFDPEFVHDRILVLGELLGKFSFSRRLVSSLFYFEDKILAQDLAGLHFANPVGLAAGFDKNAELTGILPSVGFGFEEVGSITGEPCAGNAKPRLWRIPEQKSLLVYYGLKNDGCEAIARRLKNKQFTVPLGTSIAKTNSPETVSTEKGIADYVKTHQVLASIGDYVTVNISCPNAHGGEPFVDGAKLEALLTELEKVQTKKPMFIKFAADLSEQLMDELLKVIDNHKVAGIICSNLTKDHSLLGSRQQDFSKHGGLSGKLQEPLSNRQLAYIYNRTRGKYILIGCGGIFSAEDAYVKIRLGASLVQLITGMIFEGPQLIGQINRGLAELLRKDGFANVSQAVGVDAEKTL